MNSEIAPPPVPRARGVFCNRTLNFNAVRAIGYDMDYTLIHYRVDAWEKRAYEYLKERLQAEGWPVSDLAFDPTLVLRGLIIDTELGNVVKANRFGYVKRAFHGTRPLEFDAQRKAYQRTLVDLNLPRWVFLNTLFSISQACITMQLVDLLDSGRLPALMGYEDLYRHIRRCSDEIHMEGRLKAEIIANPAEYVELDPETPQALLDQKRAGKRILLITNSGWSYAAPMLSFAFDSFLPGSMTWRDIFDIVLVGAMKPDFFSVRMPVFELATEEGLLREHHGGLETGKIYVGGNARLVEESLGLRGEEILYVGDHIFVDVNVSKSILRWRTALILRELEDEIAAVEAFEPVRKDLTHMMAQKELMESQFANLRLRLLRAHGARGAGKDASGVSLKARMESLHSRIVELDNRIGPLAQAAGSLLNPNWGPLMRTGIDKSHLTRQVERYADIYTARVSNFLYITPFAFLRSHRGSLPHDSFSEEELG